MKTVNLNDLPGDEPLCADLLIIGAGPAGLTVAREFFGAKDTDVVILESGLEEQSSVFAALNAIEYHGDLLGLAQVAKRTAFHGESAALWSATAQPYGVRCCALGGSSHAWAGKSATFDPIDFEQRAWVLHSGWPIGRTELDPYLDRAAALLNLGPNCYDDGFWRLIGAARLPQPQLDPYRLRGFFWQFARSKADNLDIMRLGKEFARETADNVRVILNATAIEVNTDKAGNQVRSVTVSSIEGKRKSVKARTIVLAASAIGNARLLLASMQQDARGIGNTHDVVGRYLMDHPGGRIARIGKEDIAKVDARFGFYGLRSNGRTHMYMHGLALSPAVQRADKLLNSALYFAPRRSPDDPWDALKRLLQRRAPSPLSDLFAIAKSPMLLAKGIGRRALENTRLPPAARSFVVDLIVRTNPNFVAREFQTRGLPHKILELSVDAITEQPPDPENRVSLSTTKRDGLGQPLARVDWSVGDAPRATLARLGRLMAEEFTRAGLPQPVLEDWITHDRLEDAVLIDMAHSMGTTRMSDNPRTGVVDRNCRVHGVANLYVAGASVFPTSGHANPTLMLVALAVRLADHLKKTGSGPSSGSLH